MLIPFIASHNLVALYIWPHYKKTCMMARRPDGQT